MTTHLFRLHLNTPLQNPAAFCLKHTPHESPDHLRGFSTNARLRMAGGHDIIERDTLEIVSLLGFDTSGYTGTFPYQMETVIFGVDTCTGSIVYTTAEIVIADIDIIAPSDNMILKRFTMNSSFRSKIDTTQLDTPT